VAAVCNRGHSLKFCAPFVRALPDPVVQDLVAHELAHVYQAACGMELISDPTVMASVMLEWEADELVLDWGFDVYALDEWLERVPVPAPFAAADPTA
jgi:hypothetical protein